MGLFRRRRDATQAPTEPDPQCFVEAAKILLAGAGYGLGFVHVRIDDIKTPPSLVVELQQRHFAQNEIQAKDLELGEKPYLDGVRILEEMGAPGEDIRGGLHRDDQGYAALERGTYGKEGADTHREYTRVTFSVPVTKLNRQQALDLVEVAGLMERTNHALGILFPARATPDTDDLPKFRRVSGRTGLQLPLNQDYALACEQLRDIREAAQEVITEQGAKFSVDDLLPKTPDDTEYENDLKGKVEQARLLLATAGKVDTTRKRKQLWTHDEEIRKSGFDDVVARTPSLFAALGFSDTTAKRKATTTILMVTFPKSFSQSEFSAFEDELHRKVDEIPFPGDKKLEVSIGDQDLKSISLKHFPTEGIKTLGMRFSKRRPSPPGGGMATMEDLTPQELAMVIDHFCAPGRAPEEPERPARQH